MADPLSITASIAGLISLAQTLISLLSPVVQGIRGYLKKFQAVVEEVHDLCGRLHAIRLILQRLKRQQGSVARITSTKVSCLPILAFEFVQC